MVDQIAMMAEAHLKPKLIFWRCLDLLARERVLLPSVYRLSSLIGAAIQRRKQQLIERIDELMLPDLRTALDDRSDGGPAPQVGRASKILSATLNEAAGLITQNLQTVTPTILAPRPR